MEEKRRDNIMIPYSLIGVIVAVLLQTMGAVWWSSGVSVKLDYQQRSIADLTQTVIDGTKNRYTALDAEKDWSANERRLAAAETEIRDSINRITRLEDSANDKIRIDSH